MNEVAEELDTVRKTTLLMWRWAMQKRRATIAERPDWEWGSGYWAGVIDAYSGTLKDLRLMRRHMRWSVQEEDAQSRAADEVAAAEARMGDR